MIFRNLDGGVKIQEAFLTSIDSFRPCASSSAPGEQLETGNNPMIVGTLPYIFRNTLLDDPGLLGGQTVQFIKESIGRISVASFRWN